MKLRAIAFVAGMLIVPAALAVVQSKVEYSADTLLETAEVSMKGRVNYTPTRERREMTMSSSGQKMIMIVRQDKKVTWTLMPAEKMYMEMALNQSREKTDLGNYKIEQTVVGPETVKGVSTTKNKIIMTGPNGEKMGGFMWLTKDNIMVKLDAIAVDKKQKHRFKMELTNLKVGKQDPALFEVPAGYEKMGMPAIPGMPGQGGGGLNLKDLMKQMR